MKIRFNLAIITAYVIAVLPALAQVPQLINYQGRIAVGTVNFDGSGQFKFALVNADGSTTFWSNDGTSTAGSEPTAPVTITVTKGLYSVLLGDTTLANMTIVPATVFTNSDVRLRVWFNDSTNGFQLLTPDQRIAAVGYAMMAGSVPDGSVTSAKLAPGAVATSLPAGSAILSSSPVQSALQSQGFARLDTGLSVGGTTMYVYERHTDPVLRYTVVGPDDVEFVVGQPQSIDFGEATSSPIERVLTIRNLGNESLTGLVLTLDGADSRDFKVTLAAVNVPPGAVTTAILIFDPSGFAGSRTAGLHVSTDLVSRSFDLTLNGEVAAPEGFVRVPAGTFTRGATSGDTISGAPTTMVTVSNFYLQATETTKAEWDDVRDWAFVNGYGSMAVGGGKSGNHPVQTITWWDAVRWCNARSEKEGLTPCYTVGGLIFRSGNIEPECNWDASGYRLPTEAEWEKAGRGGIERKRFPWGTDLISHSDANFRNDGDENYTSGTTGHHPTYAAESQPFTSPVGSFSPNGFGLRDMAGNVREWCWDWYDIDYYVTSEGATDPRGPSVGTLKISRGASWSIIAAGCRLSTRGTSSPDFTNFNAGFRPARK